MATTVAAMNLLADLLGMGGDEWIKWVLGIIASFIGLIVLGLISLVVWRIPSGASNEILRKLVQDLESAGRQGEKERQEQALINTRLLADLELEKEERAKLQEAVADLTLENRKLKVRITELESARHVAPPPKTGVRRRQGDTP